MTTQEFNKKYQKYLEDRFYGLEIEKKDIIDLCDEYFQNWVKIPNFKYSQIKVKFGTSRVYCTPHEVPTEELEIKIDKLLHNENSK